MSDAERQAADKWLMSWDTGTSSLTMFTVLSRRTDVLMAARQGRADIPYDPDDFGRCYRLLQAVPSWRNRLVEVADAYPKWRPFVESWDELTALFEEEFQSGWAPKTYNRMRSLRGEAPIDLPSTRPTPKRRRTRKRGTK